MSPVSDTVRTPKQANGLRSMNTRRWVVLAASLAALLGIGAWVLSSSSNGDTPISEQECWELARTIKPIAKTIRTGWPPQDVEQAMRDEIAVERRQRELGGCPGWPSLE